MEIYLIRHTPPQIAKGICYGQSDIPLSKTFTSEARKLITHLPKSFDVVYSSPLKRCHALAQYININRLVIQDERLLEMNFGDWEMKRWDKIKKGDLEKWMNDFANRAAPNGENFIDLNNRTNKFINELVHKKYKKVIIVTHAGVIRCFLSRILELPLKSTFKIACDYTSITKIRFDGNVSRVEYLNRVY
ncbi:MAG TPA: alpha-ribazole phosphatase [Bacteroidia bacterium]|nr:alpha-ribazole phosphatase [Bacteroidia bacterium]